MTVAGVGSFKGFGPAATRALCASATSKGVPPTGPIGLGAPSAPVRNGYAPVVFI